MKQSFKVLQRGFLKGFGFLSYLWLFLFTLVALTFPFWAQESGLDADLKKAYTPPFVSTSNFLGTDHLGRDVLLSLLYSCRTAWFLAFPPMVIATMIGMATGTGAASFRSKGATVSSSLFLSMPLFLIGCLYLWTIIKENSLVPLLDQLGAFAVFAAGLAVLMLAAILLQLVLKWLPVFQKDLQIPVDALFLKLTDFWATFPKLLLLLLLSLFTSPSLYGMMGWITITFWVLPGRITRALTLQVQQKPFLEAAKAVGIPQSTIFFRYIFPALQGPLLVNFCFSAAGLLGIGSTLAFLGIGLPPEVPSWGKMLAGARFSLEAWWLLIFPASVLLLSILSLQSIGHQISSRKN
ncbi:MAG: ABC transporter permease [Rufibacter sp.]